MNPPPSAVDVVTLFAVIAALVFSNEVAIVVAPYILIIVASLVGASFALGRRETTSKLNAAFFFIRVAGMAVFLTAWLASYISTKQPDLHERLLLAPIAIFIGWIGDDWPKIFTKVLKFALRMLDLARGKGEAPND